MVAVLGEDKELLGERDCRQAMRKCWWRENNRGPCPCGWPLLHRLARVP
jgi:hypothetical protein